MHSIGPTQRLFEEFQVSWIWRHLIYKDLPTVVVIDVVAELWKGRAQATVIGRIVL